MISPEILAYNNLQSQDNKEICDVLANTIHSNLPEANCKIWHAHPVWFIAENPIVGYSKLKNCVRLLFWSGQSFNEEKLIKEGSFKAAEIRYQNSTEIQIPDLKDWLKKAAIIQWDYKNLIKRKGVLIQL